MGRSALIAIAKDEGADIFEWALFHSLIGFGKIVVYDNGSSDNMLAEIARAARFCDITAVAWPGIGQQLLAYQDALRRFGPRHDYLCFLDIDEFLFLYSHERVGPFLASVEPATAIAVSWRMFGSSGHVARPPGYVLENYRRCSPDAISANRHVKSVVRVAGLTDIRMATPHNVDAAYVDAAGQPVRWIPNKPNGGKADRLCAPAVARVHHYHTKSAEDYRAKLRRGNATSGRPRSDRFRENDGNEEEAPAFSPFHRRILARLREADLSTR